LNLHPRAFGRSSSSTWIRPTSRAKRTIASASTPTTACRPIHTVDTNIDAMHWQVNYNGGASHEVITFQNGASIDASDFLFS
jgi:hypothetical protein